MPANIVVPEMGESIVDARIAKWLKQEGDQVSVGEPLVELETDKVDVEVAAPQSGVLSSIAHATGADVKIGDILGVVSEGKGQRAEGKGREKVRRQRF
jgi:2-oxoglutarate dehydrogenase E2 component (dihydrolipoamide succinyltransferase)